MMNRTERRCLLASAALHGLLVFVLLVAPAFLSSRPKETKTAADFIAAGDVEKVLGGRSGGAPAVALQPAPPAQQVQKTPQPQSQQTRAEPEPQPVPEVTKPAPQPKLSKNALENKPQEKKQYDIKPTSTEKTETAKKAAPQKAPEKTYALTKTKPTTTKSLSSSTQSSSPSAAQQQWSKSVGDLAKRIGKSGSGGVDIPEIGTGAGGGGGGAGGSGLGDYASLVKAVYDNAWIDPSDVNDTSASVKVVIVIARSGAIISAKVISRSGNSNLDSSVQKALDRVTKIPQPFPPEIRDSQLSFTINFNLGNRRRLG